MSLQGCATVSERSGEWPCGFKGESQYKGKLRELQIKFSPHPLNPSSYSITNTNLPTPPLISLFNVRIIGQNLVHLLYPKGFDDYLKYKYKIGCQKSNTFKLKEKTPFQATILISYVYSYTMCREVCLPGHQCSDLLSHGMRSVKCSPWHGCREQGMVCL